MADGCCQPLMSIPGFVRWNFRCSLQTCWLAGACFGTVDHVCTSNDLTLKIGHWMVFRSGLFRNVVARSVLTLMLSKFESHLGVRGVLLPSLIAVHHMPSS